MLDEILIKILIDHKRHVFFEYDCLNVCNFNCVTDWGFNDNLLL